MVGHVDLYCFLQVMSPVISTCFIHTFHYNIVCCAPATYWNAYKLTLLAKYAKAAIK